MATGHGNITEIDREESTEQQKREKVFLKWKEQQVPALTEVGNKATADKVQQMATKEPTFTQKNILSALKDVVDWKSLGVQLDITAAKIREIDVNNRGQVMDCRHDLVMLWLESDVSCSWKKLIAALRSTGLSVLAQEIETTYWHQDRSELNNDAVLANCGCGHCDFKRLISIGCPRPQRGTQFNYLDTAGLSPSQKDILLFQVKKAADDIHKQLRDVVTQFDTWMERNVSIKEYRKALKNIQGVVSGRKEVPMLKDRWNEIKIADHLECSAILSDYYTWFNCDILKEVIEIVKPKKRSDQAKLLSSLKSYVDKVYEYSKRNIFECPATSQLSRTKGITYLILKVSITQLPEQENKVTAEEIANFTAKLKQSLQLQDYTLKLCTVDNGCLQLVYSIPLCVYNALFPLDEDQLKAIQVLGVMEIITKDHHYKKEHNKEQAILIMKPQTENQEMLELPLMPELEPLEPLRPVSEPLRPVSRKMMLPGMSRPGMMQREPLEEPLEPLRRSVVKMKGVEQGMPPRMPHELGKEEVAENISEIAEANTHQAVK